MNSQHDPTKKSGQTTLPTRSKIAAMGAAFPSRVLPNSEVSEKSGVSEDWIFERVGIKERRIMAEGEQNSDIAASACLIALERAQISPIDVDLILACTNSPDRWMPSMASVVQAKIGASHSAAFDIVTACAGWMAGLQTADAFIRSGLYSKILVVGSEAQSRFLDWSDKTTSILFGDGAGASVISKGNAEGEGEILGTRIYTDGRFGNILQQPGTGSRDPASHEVVEKKMHFLQMDGEKVFMHAVKKMVASSREILKEHGLKIEDIDWFVPHQANIWIIKMVGDQLGISPEKIAINIEKYGNTTAATIPICMNEYIENGLIRRGDLILMTTFGAGLTWGSCLVRW